ncbi:MAG: hypothetical protein IT359_13670 [Gemmatimonadaceae bacterium]|nr:hypothetical protein [Gemmatimonadaceae bacterium]
MILLATGCTGDHPRTLKRTLTLRDSGGIVIAEQESVEQFTAKVVLSTRPFLDLGGVSENPDAELSPQAPWLEPVRLSDGRYAVADMQRIALFSADGRFIKGVGSQGDGPGEFQQVGRVCVLPDDSLLAISENDGRLILWDSAGRHVATYARVGPVLIDSCFADGSVIVPTIEGGAPGDSDMSAQRGTDQSRVAYYRVRRDGAVIANLGEFPRSRLDAEVSYVVQVYYAHGRLIVADPRSFQLRQYDTTGTLRSIVRLTKPPPPHRRPVFARPRPGRAPFSVTAPGVSSAAQATEPAFGRVLVDSLGRYWIQGGDTETEKWTFIDAKHGIGARLAFPILKDRVTSRIVSAATDHVVVLSYDDDGAPHLRFCRFAVVP